MKNSNGADKHRDFSPAERIRSFGPALKGLLLLVREEHNARIHVAIFVLAAAAGLLFGISADKWLIIFIVSGLVFISECFNTAIEHLSDRIAGEPDEHIRKAKDLAAAGVLIAAVISAIAGLIIFVPEIVKLAGG